MGKFHGTCQNIDGIHVDPNFVEPKHSYQKIDFQQLYVYDRKKNSTDVIYFPPKFSMIFAKDGDFPMF